MQAGGSGGLALLAAGGAAGFGLVSCWRSLPGPRADAASAPPEEDAEGSVVGAYTVAVGSQRITLPLMKIAPDLAISLLMTIDEPIAFIDTAGAELADALLQLGTAVDASGVGIEVVVTAATLGIPVGSAVAKTLGHSRQVVLQKTEKKHLADALVEPLASITSHGKQQLRLDRRWVPLLKGKRVAFVDDVISSGGSCIAALNLIRAAGGDVVAIGAILVEGDSWKRKLGVDASMVVALGQIPLFKPAAGGRGWVEDWRKT